LLIRASMETMHPTPDTEALLDCDSFRAALLRCLSAFKDRPLIGIIERRRGRGSTSAEPNVETAPADARGEGAWGGGVGNIFDSGPASSKARGADKDRRKSKVHFATYAKLHRLCQYIGYSIVNQLMLPHGSSCGILCRSSQHAREIVAWQLACVLGGFVLVLTDWDAAPPHADELGSEVDAGAEEIMQSARGLVREGVRAVLAEEAAVAPLIVAVAEIAAGLTREQASRRRLVRDIVVVGCGRVVAGSCARACVRAIVPLSHLQEMGQWARRERERGASPFVWCGASGWPDARRACTLSEPQPDFN